jgi:hypothetical protein
VRRSCSSGHKRALGEEIICSFGQESYLVSPGPPFICRWRRIPSRRQAHPSPLTVLESH